MGFFRFLKYICMIFAAHLATSCGVPFEKHWSRGNGLDLYSGGASFESLSGRRR
jgi:hypothetical protein